MGGAIIARQIEMMVSAGCSYSKKQEVGVLSCMMMTMQATKRISGIKHYSPMRSKLA